MATVENTAKYIDYMRRAYQFCCKVHSRLRVYDLFAFGFLRELLTAKKGRTTGFVVRPHRRQQQSLTKPDGDNKIHKSSAPLVTVCCFFTPRLLSSAAMRICSSQGFSVKLLESATQRMACWREVAPR